MIAPPPRYDGTFDVFFNDFVEPNLPTPQSVRTLDAALRRYVATVDPVFFLRQVDGVERVRRNGAPFRPGVTMGCRIAFTDNSPQWALHALALKNELPQADEFDVWIRDQMPCHLHDVRGVVRGTLNDHGWHAAHILNVKDGNTAWQTWDRAELVRRFMRNVHPCNLLLLPKTDWQRLGKQADLLAFAVSRYRERYGAVLDQGFALMGGAPPKSGAIPTIRYEPTTFEQPTSGNTLVLRESSGQRIHLEGFGARFAGTKGEDRFSVTVELLDGTVLGLSRGFRRAPEGLVELQRQNAHSRC
jgi:hypothetical protein